ncbi:MAG: hypothetical protein HQ402_00785 [Parcubacteria group bacterium]|nr:hypothetical protein [Parcubacteria group bacterium]
MGNKRNNNIILFSGIPASGKSTYGKWLEEEKGMIYWDLEHETLEEVEKRSGLYIGRGHDLGSFLEAVKETDRIIVIDWGFPPDTMLGEIKNLFDNKVKLWWFDGDRKSARTSFLKRGTVSEEALDIQMKKIEDHWPQIKNLFGENIIQSINSNGEYLPKEEIYKIIFEN